jgi:hypothetical protein
MFGHLCVVLDGADDEGEGVAAVLADPALTAVVAAPDDDVAEDVCVVAALATAMLPPNPTPSAPAPIAVPMMILPSRVFTMSPPYDRVSVLYVGHPSGLRTLCGDALPTV